MRRRIASVLTLIFVITSIVAGIPLKVFAYQNASYNKDLKIGLKSMQSASMNLVLNGNYKVNGKLFSSGTSISIKADKGKLIVNNEEYTEAQFIPEQKDNTLSINNGVKNYKYEGSFVFKVMSDKVFPINIINIEEYLKGVVGLEMSDYFPLEALKAQAVAARNYALQKVGACASLGYDFDDTEYFQVYGGLNENYKKVISAVEQTKGMVLVYNGKLVEAFYSASHGGYSESSANVWGAALPYLVSKADTFENENWPLGNRTFTGSQIESVLKSKGHIASTDKFVKIDMDSITRYPSTRVSGVSVVYKDLLGSEKVKSFTRDSARTFLSLPSSMYTVVYDETSGMYTFSGKGYGHGIGMSQIGAKNRAAAGQSYEDILKFYFEGSSLYKLPIVEEVKPAVPASPEVASITASGTLYEKRAVSVKAAVSNPGTSALTYRFQLSKSGKVIETKEFKTPAAYTFTPSSAGSYKVNVTVNGSAKEISINVLAEPLKISKSSLKKWARGGDVVKVQNALKKLGYNVGASDGIFGNTTYTQLVKFQKAKKVKATGIVDSATLKALNEALIAKSGSRVISSTVKAAPTKAVQPAPAKSTPVVPLKISSTSLKKWARGGDVVKVQNALKKLGYNVGASDGIFGAKTYAQVVKFQKAKKIKATGVVDSATLKALNSALIAKKITKI